MTISGCGYIKTLRRNLYVYVKKTGNECIRTEQVHHPPGSQGSTLPSRCDSGVCCTPHPFLTHHHAFSTAETSLPPTLPTPHLCGGVSLNTHSPSSLLEDRGTLMKTPAAGNPWFKSVLIPSVAFPCMVSSSIWQQN